MERLLAFNHIEIILLGVAGILLLIQLLYYFICYAKPYKIQLKNESAENAAEKVFPPVSVIVYAKNESENLDRFLYTILQQDYPEYQVIVVNDGSTDESDEVLNRYENQYAHLYHTYIPEDVKYLSRKKLALTVGIKAAKYDILLFTEANCRPLGNRWITGMARNFTEGTDIVLGFCAYENKNGFLHKLAGYDNLITGVRYLSSALGGKPFMGCGKNLAYRKKLFFDHKGYSQSLNLHAGEDDLFINQLATPQNTRVEYEPESILVMASYERFRVWKEMKVSRAATMRYFKGHRLLFYRIESVTRYVFTLAIAGLIAVGVYGNPVCIGAAVVLWVTRYVAQATVLKRAATMLQQKTLTTWLPLLNLLHPLYGLYVRVYRIFRGKNDYTFRLGK